MSDDDNLIDDTEGEDAELEEQLRILANLILDRVEDDFNNNTLKFEDK